jgi:hypothetical protein
MTELEQDAEGLTETLLYLNLGFICFVGFGFWFFVCLFVLDFSPLMRQENIFPDTNTRTGG